MRIHKVEFRASTHPNLYCDLCNNKIIGKEGFLFLGLSKKGWKWIDHQVKICVNCFNEILEQKIPFEKNREELYKKKVKEKEKRIKKTIIRGLK